MGEVAGLAATSCGHTLREITEQHRRRAGRIHIAAAGLAGCLPCLAAAFWNPPSLLIWNVSASAPRGLYLAVPGVSLRRGDIAVVHLTTKMASLAAERHYIPLGVPLLKRVAATVGDRVCVRGRVLTINGRAAATRRLKDVSGRLLPSWHGCVHLGQGEYLLLSANPWSFDGRYFGITHASQIIGRAKLLRFELPVD